MSLAAHTTARDTRVVTDAGPTNSEFGQFGAGIVTAATPTPATLNDAIACAAGAGLAYPPSLTELRSVLTVTTGARGTGSHTAIAVRDDDALTATRLADAVAQATVAWDRQRARSAIDDLVRSLTLQIEALDQQVAELMARDDVTQDQIVGRANLRAEQQEQLYYACVLAGSASGLLSVLQRAELPDEPVAPRPVLNAALAASLAITVVLLVGLLRDLLDTRVRTIDQVPEITNLPLLAAFPTLPDDSRHAPREAANFLRANLAFALASAHPKFVVATSAGPSEGKTTLTVGLATAFTRQDYRTLLVDLDLRNPMVGQVLAISHSEGRIGRALTQSDEPLEVETVMLDEELPVDVIPAIAGLDHPGERISAGIGSLLARGQEHHDVIVFDTAPLMAVADALPVAFATATVLAVSLERSNRRQLANRWTCCGGPGRPSPGRWRRMRRPGRGERGLTGLGMGRRMGRRLRREYDVRGLGRRPGSQPRARTAPLPPRAHDRYRGASHRYLDYHCHLRPGNESRFRVLGHHRARRNVSPHHRL